MRDLRYLLTIALMSTAFPFSGLAQIAKPAKSISEVSTESQPEKVVRLAKARVILADYDLLKKDFSELQSLDNGQIDQWLLDHVAYISIPQTKSKKTNTEIPVGRELIEAQRPPNYNRALVFKAGTGLIDSKGNGSLNPYHGGHGNGLATLGEMIREYIYQKLIQKVFDHSGSGLKTVANYGVLDFGFRVIHNDSSSSQAGSVLRQAHARAQGYMSLLPTEQVVKIEKLLRKYGVTTTGTKRDASYDLLNAQGTNEGAVIDFGGYLVVKELKKPAMDIETSKVFFIPEKLNDIKPDVNFRVPYSLWGSSVTGDDDSKTDNPFVWSHELAESLAQGRAVRADAEQHLRNLLEPIDATFQKHPRTKTCRNLFGK